MKTDNLKYPESWDQAKRHSILKNTGLGTSYEYDIEQAARIMAEAYEKRIAELESTLDKLFNTYIIDTDECGEPYTDLFTLAIMWDDAKKLLSE